MTKEQYFKNLNVPNGKVDIVLDTDTYNEVDDLFALCWALKCEEKFNIKGICAAPFFNHLAFSAAEGMEKSYNEILKLLKMANKHELSEYVFKGSKSYLPDEATAVESAAADFIADLASNYSSEKPLYIVAIGAITNVASAIIKNPNIKENCVIVWLGGHDIHFEKPVSEFNMRQDIAAARVVFNSGAPMVWLPCNGVIDRLNTNKYELKHWLKDKNSLCDYLYEFTVNECERIIPYKAWSKTIWDIAAIAWFMNDENRFMSSKKIPAFMPEHNGEYSFDEKHRLIEYVTRINRDAIFEDLFLKLAEFD